MERALNSPKLFYGLLGVLCSCYVTFAAIEHVMAKKKQETASHLSLAMPFEKKPEDAKARPSEYGGLFFVRDNEVRAGEKDASAVPAAEPNEQVDTKEDELPAESPDFAGLLPEGTVVFPAEKKAKAAGSGGLVFREFKPVGSLGSNSPGGSGGGSSAGAGAPTQNVDSPTQLAALGPTASRPPGMSDAMRRVTAITPGARQNEAAQKSSGVRGSQSLPKGAMQPARTTSTEPLTEDADSPISAAGALPTGAIGAGALPEKSSKTDKPAASSKSEGGGGGGSSGSNNAQNMGLDSGNCKTVQTTNGLRQLCGDAASQFNTNNQTPYDAGYSQGYDNYPTQFVPAEGTLDTGEFFREKSFWERVKEGMGARFDGTRKLIGGAMKLVEGVIESNPVLKAAATVVSLPVKAVDWVINGVARIFGRKDYEPLKPLENAFKGVYNWFTGDNAEKPKFDLSMDTVYKYQRKMFQEFIGKSADQKRAIIARYEQQFAAEYRNDYWKELNAWYVKRAEEINKKAKDNPYYDKAANIAMLNAELQQDYKELAALPTGAIGQEFVRKLLPDVPDDSRIIALMAMPGIDCKPGSHPVLAPYESKAKCVSDENWITRGWKWEGKLLSDGGEALSKLGKETKEGEHPVVATVLGSALGVPLVMANPLIGIPVLIGQAVGLISNDAKKSADDSAKTDVPGATEKKKDCGFLGLGCVKDAIVDFFTGGREDTGKKPDCGMGTRLTKYGGQWICVAMPAEAEADQFVEPPAQFPVSSAATLPLKAAPGIPYQMPEQQFAGAQQPNCGPGFVPQQTTIGWNCVFDATQQPAIDAPQIRIGDGTDLFNVDKCPDGTRPVATNSRGDMNCVGVQGTGPGIFIQTGQKGMPWMQLKKCPPGTETVISHKPSPGDMTCRTP